MELGWANGGVGLVGTSGGLGVRMEKWIGGVRLG